VYVHTESKQMKEVYTNHDNTRRRFHTEDCRLYRTHMVVEDEQELRRRGYQPCQYCLCDNYGPSLLSNADPEDMGLSPMGERP